jgi:hypothetical protein
MVTCVAVCSLALGCGGSGGGGGNDEKGKKAVEDAAKAMQELKAKRKAEQGG